MYNELKEIKNSIAIFPPSGDISATYDFPLYVLSGMYFNYLEDIPADLVFNDFEHGILYTNPLTLKNMYDPDWGIDSSIVPGVSGTISNNRYYVDVHADEDEVVYNVYKFARDYTSTSYVSGITSGEADSINMQLIQNVDNGEFTQWGVALSAISGWTISATDPASGFVQKELVLSKPWLYSLSGENSMIWQDDVFIDSNVGDLFSIEIDVIDHLTGILNVYQNDNLILSISEQGLYQIVHPVVDSATSLSGRLIFITSGYTDTVIYSVYTQPIDVIDNYQHIERIDGSYVYGDIPLHKSNVFSIRIKDSNLNDMYTDSDKVILQKSINNIIRDVIQKITPVHTQLFDIFWTGD